MTLYKRALFKRFKTKYAPDEVDKLAVLIIVSFLTFFSILGCIQAYASEVETISLTRVDGIVASENSNAFSVSSGTAIKYFEVEKGYKYTIQLLINTSGDRIIVGSSDIPSANVPYTILYTGLNEKDETYNYYAYSDNILFLSVSPNIGDTNILITREKMQNYEGAVQELVDNVGTQQIWDVFNISIDYIIIAVAVAFGIFLIVLAIRKVSKGKSEF